MEPDTQAERIASCHWLLLGLAGTIPDDLVTQCRWWLAQGDVTGAGQAIAYAVFSQRIALTDDDIDLLAELLGAAAVDASALSLVNVLDVEPMPKYAFAPRRPPASALPGLAAADDRPGVPVCDPEPADAMDRALLAALAPPVEIRAVWRAWRAPSNGAKWPRPRRVFVIETDRDVDLAQTAGRLQSALHSAGEADPQVEVYPVHATVPSYQRLARAYGALIWTREPDPGLRIACVFDQVDNGEPHMAPDHPVIHGRQVGQLIEYLQGGEPLLVTMARRKDVVNPQAGTVVPTNFRTDGRWIWSDASTYYLEQYGLVPDPELVAHIEALSYVAPEVDGAAIHRALAALNEPAADEPAWTYGT